MARGDFADGTRCLPSAGVFACGTRVASRVRQRAGRRSVGGAALPDPVVVEVDPAAGGLGRIIEQRVAVTHEVREGVDKARRTTDGGPGFAVEAVGKARHFRLAWYAVDLGATLVDAEAGVVRRGLEFAFDLEVNGIAGQGN